MKEFLIVVWWLIFFILFIAWFVWCLESYTFRMWWIMDKHEAQKCERAIEYKLHIPSYCNVESLSWSIETWNRI